MFEALRQSKMITTFHIHRTSDFVKTQTLESGQNFPSSIEVEIFMPLISTQAREILLSYWDGKYYNTFIGFRHDWDFEPRLGASFGTKYLVSDELNITPEIVSELIIQTRKALAENHAEEKEKRKVIESERLVKEKIREAVNEEKRNFDKQLVKLEAERNLLALFLTYIPRIAKEKALSEMVEAKIKENHQSIRTSLESQIEEASCYHVFDQKEED